MVKPISREPTKAASRALPGLDMADDVLDHDDGVIDDESDRDGQRHQRHVVDACSRADT